MALHYTLHAVLPVYSRNISTQCPALMQRESTAGPSLPYLEVIKTKSFWLLSSTQDERNISPTSTGSVLWLGHFLFVLFVFRVQGF